MNHQGQMPPDERDGVQGDLYAGKNENSIEAMEAQGDFYYMMGEALQRCGSDALNVEHMRRMTLQDCVEVLAQSGLRIVYMKEKDQDLKNASR